MAWGPTETANEWRTDQPTIAVRGNGEFTEALVWCREFCKGGFSIAYYPLEGRYRLDLKFSEINDAIYAKLRWYDGDE